MSAAQTAPDLDAALRHCARPLIALATQLHTSVPVRPAETRAAAGAAVERLERELTEAGADARSVAVASYLLCVWLDEGLALAPMPMPQGLLWQFHGEADGGTRVFELLERLLPEPEANRPLLGLFHTALSLGLQGRWREAVDGPRRIEVWRQRVATALRLPDAPLSQPLSAHWQPAVVPRRVGRERRVIASGLLVLALAGVGVYSASQVLLARQVDAVFASLQGLEPAPPAGVASGPVPDRLVVRLGVLPVEGLFRADTVQLQPPTSPQPQALDRIGQVLAARPGRVLVTAYARPDTPRPARLASASQLADEWAQQVARALQAHLPLPAGRVVAEGRVERDAAAGTAGAGVERVEITLFPSATSSP